VDGGARAFGGGGHPNAAGCSLTGTLEEAREELLSELARQGVL
jgi:nanoRNase/pAp phosphatase (c-di-AMP/oligoRNAs hydrolase)